MNERNQDCSRPDPWRTWIQERAEAAPTSEAVDRAKQAMLSADAEETKVSRPSQLSTRPDSGEPSGGWERQMQSLSEQSWGRLALCAAALLLGLTPYIGAVYVLHS